LSFIKAASCKSLIMDIEGHAEERPTKLRKLSHPYASEREPTELGNVKEATLNQQNEQPSENLSPGRASINDDDAYQEAKKPETEGIPENSNQSSNQNQLSKNKLRKLRRQQAWEAGRQDRALKRREKRKKKQELRRAELAHAMESGEAVPNKPTKPTTVGYHIPMSFIIDCSFDDLMNDNEITSLSQQIARSYNSVRTAKYRPKLFISGYSGRLSYRFENIMQNQHKSWRGVQVLEGSISEANEQATSWMKEVEITPQTPLPQHIIATGDNDKSDVASPSIVYLSSESSNVLSSLSPNTSYVIGGLVDKNRHKGHCYMIAQKNNIATARLPIDEYVKLSSRKVLTTNHVVEIMLRYLETGNWEESFLNVIPQRKGVEKKDDKSESADEGKQDHEDADDEDS
jgi:tRNA (guanine9-N1)-methyltransferase